MEIQIAEKPEVKTREVIEKELKFDKADAVVEEANVSPEIANQANDIFEKLLAIDSKDLSGQEKYAKAIQTR